MGRAILTQAAFEWTGCAASSRLFGGRGVVVFPVQGSARGVSPPGNRVLIPAKIRAEGARCRPDGAVEGAGEMRLVGKSGKESDLRQSRPFAIAKKRCRDLQPCLGDEA